MSNDFPGGNSPSVFDLSGDGPELPDGKEQPGRDIMNPVTAGDDGHPDDSILDPPLIPLSEITPSPGGRRRGRFGGMAPAAKLLPLVLVSLLVYLLKPGWIQQAAPEVQPQPTETAVVVSQPSRSSARVEATTPPSVSVGAEDLDRLLAEAQALTGQSKFEQAIDNYQELARQSPDDARPEVGWAQALLLDGLPDQALSHARLALALDPGNQQAAVALAQAYVGLGDKVRGLNAAQNALALDTRNAEAHAVLAEAYLLLDQPLRAMEEANLALALDQGSAEAHRVRGRLYETIDKDLDAAVRELRLAADLQPRLWLRHYDLGRVLLKAEDHDAAIVALTEAWVLNRTESTYSALGQAYYRLGEVDRAASYLEQSLSAGAWNVDTYALLASIRAQGGRCGDAMTYVQHALTQDPNHPLALEARDRCTAAGSDLAATPAVASTAPAAQDEVGSSALPSRAGGRIAFPVWNQETGRYDTYVANTDGSRRELVVEGMHQPAFSPDGQWLAVNGEYPEHQNLFVVRPDGSDLREITEHVEDGLPCWSPAPPRGDTGELELAFSSTRHGDKQSRVYVLDWAPIGGQEIQARPLNSGADDVRGEYPAWALDGDLARVVYAGCYYDGVSGQCGLILISAEPGPQNPQPLTNYPDDTAPAAHGSRIAFMSNRDGNWEIYLVNSDGSELKRLTHNTSNDGLPTWSPDGKTIAFISDEGGTWAVWAVGPDGSDRRKLFDLGGAGLASDWQHERISWGRDTPAND